MEHHARQRTGNKSPWDWPGLDFISFCTEQKRDGEIEKVRREIFCMSRACDTRALTGLGGIMTVNLGVLMSAPMEEMDYASSCLFE